jgi:PAS domain S-box-containing protein
VTAEIPKPKTFALQPKDFTCVYELTCRCATVCVASVRRGGGVASTSHDLCRIAPSVEDEQRLTMRRMLSQGAAVALPEGRVETIGEAPAADRVRELVDRMFADGDTRSVTGHAADADAMQGARSRLAYRHIDDVDPGARSRLAYRHIDDVDLYWRAQDPSGKQASKTAALVIDIKERCFLVWFRKVNCDDEQDRKEAWSASDLDEANDLGLFVSDLISFATGKTLSNDALVRLNDQRMRTRSDLYSLAHEVSSMLKTAGAPIFSLDRNRRVVMWNDEMQRLTNVSKEEACGSNISDYLSEEDNEALVNILVPVLASDSADRSSMAVSKALELRFRCKNVVELLVTASRFSPFNTSSLAITCFGQDVSATKRALQECQAVANEHENLISESGIPVFFVDAALRVNGWNDVMAEITGIKKQEALGLRLIDEVLVLECVVMLVWVLCMCGACGREQ